MSLEAVEDVFLTLCMFRKKFTNFCCELCLKNIFETKSRGLMHLKNLLDLTAFKALDTI